MNKATPVTQKQSGNVQPNTESTPNADGRLNWHPIASSTDLTPRHVYHGQLFGRELAVWRADDGNINVWENRCLHRGVRLSIGVNDGRELVCQYHGWRYANRTAGCTYIPAHPADSPARTLCNNRYPVIEKYGLVWSASAQPALAAPKIKLAAHIGCEAENTLALRPVPVNATVAVTAAQLHDYRFTHPQLDIEIRCDVQQTDQYTLTAQFSTKQSVSHANLAATADNPDNSDPSIAASLPAMQLVLLLQPVDSARTVIRGILSSQQPFVQTTSWLRTHNAALSLVRELAEQKMQAVATPAPWQVSIVPVSESLAKMPELSNSSASAQKVTVKSMDDTAADIKSIELASVDNELATYQPGSHIDLQLANGLTRQYSLTNGPGQTDHYIIGVKREPESTGGSSFIHESLKVGDVLTVSPPRNNFPLRRDAVKTLLIAGGIGITPLLSMAKTLFHSSLPFELHYFVSDEMQIAFRNSLQLLQQSVNLHTGLNPAQTSAKLHSLLKQYQPAHHVYLCGPAPMLESAQTIAAECGWPDNSIHFEYFKNLNEVSQQGAFSVSLARTGLTLQVPAGETLLSVLRKNGVDLPSSCEQGACGTCVVDVIDGTPQHQDVYLSQAEKKRGNCMMTCVSRAQSDSLTLDI